MWVASLPYVQAFPAERREFRLRRNRPNQRVWGSAPHSRDSALLGAGAPPLGAKRHKRVQGAKGVTGSGDKRNVCRRNKSFPPVRGCRRQPRTTSHNNYNAPPNYNMSLSKL